MENLNFNEKMVRVQNDLKAPKGQYNSFGKYKYRSCEDIVEAVKPILAAYNLVLNLSDELVLIGDRYYIKATASISCVLFIFLPFLFLRLSLKMLSVFAAQKAAETVTSIRNQASRQLMKTA